MGIQQLSKYLLLGKCLGNMRYHISISLLFCARLTGRNLFQEGREEVKALDEVVYKSQCRGFNDKGYSPVALKCQKVAFACTVFRLTVVWVGTGPGGLLPGFPSARKPHMLGLRESEVCPLYSFGVRVIWKKK